MKKKPIPSKKEIISVMKKYPSRSQFKWNENFYYENAKYRFPGLIDKILPKKESYTSSMGELTTKAFLESLFKKKFINCRPVWLVNPKTNKCMELDGYCEELKIAFEYGEHSRIKSFIKKERLLKTEYKDKLKIKICKKMGIKLIQIKTDIFSIKKPEESLRSQLLKEFKRLKIDQSRINKIKFRVVFPNNSKYTEKEIWRLSLQYDRISYFESNHSGAADFARRTGLMKKIQSHFKKINNTDPWTKGEIIDVANKYKTKKDFYKNNWGAYKAAIRLGILNKIYKNLKGLNYGFWSNDKNVLCAAKKCKSLKEMKIRFPGALTSLQRRKKLYLVDFLRN